MWAGPLRGKYSCDYSTRAASPATILQTQCEGQCCAEPHNKRFFLIKGNRIASDFFITLDNLDFQFQFSICWHWLTSACANLLRSRNDFDCQFWLLKVEPDYTAKANQLHACLSSLASGVASATPLLCNCDRNRWKVSRVLHNSAKEKFSFPILRSTRAAVLAGYASAGLVKRQCWLNRFHRSVYFF